jgi:hypothetical protein
VLSKLTQDHIVMNEIVQSLHHSLFWNRWVQWKLSPGESWRVTKAYSLQKVDIFMSHLMALTQLQIRSCWDKIARLLSIVKPTLRFVRWIPVQIKIIQAKGSWWMITKGRNYQTNKNTRSKILYGFVNTLFKCTTEKLCRGYGRIFTAEMTFMAGWGMKPYSMSMC